MCHDYDGLPAVPRLDEMAVEGKRIRLTASDGNHVSAFSATPAVAPRAGVVILPDNRGLSPFYEALACRVAELGYSALAIDYYGRTAGAVDDRAEDFPFMEHLMRVTRPGLEVDFTAAVQFLRSAEGGRCQAVFALGFCFGGRQAYLAAALGLGLAGVIGFYGFPGAIGAAAGPTDRADRIGSPVLAVWAGGDNIAVEQIQAFLGALSRYGVAHESVTYPGAPHSFFDIKQTEWIDASTDAWKRVCGFLDRHSHRGAGARV